MAEAAPVLSFRHSQRHVLLYLDVDGLKHVNSAYGHRAGDVVLAQVAARLTSRIRSEDIAARLGGDEFAVFSRNVADVTAALARARRLPTKPCIRPSRRDGTGSRSTPPSKHQRAERRSTVERALASAMGTDQIRLACQPQVTLRTGRVLGVEALLRWTSPTLGVVGPEEFVAVAEASRLILRLGDWVLGEACRQLARWRAAGGALASVTVNVSPAQLTDRGFADRVAGELAAHRLSPDQLCLEITETALMDHVDAVSATLRQLHALGISLAIDDFGTGLSSLAQLRELPVQILKLDRSFVADIGVDVESAGIVTAVLDLAHVLALEVIAEGVETPSQARELARRGCTVVQGRGPPPVVRAATRRALLGGAILGS